MRQKELALRDRENALIQKEVEFKVNSERNIRIISESIEQERKQLKQKETILKPESELKCKVRI